MKKKALKSKRMPAKSASKNTGKSNAGGYPVNILQDQRPTQEFDISMLPSVLKDYVAAVCETTEADPVMIVMALLGALSALINTNVHIPDGEYFQTLYPNLYMLSILESGQFKTTALRKGAKPVFQHQKKIQDWVKQGEEFLKHLKKSKGKEDNVDVAERNVKRLMIKDHVLPDRSTPEGFFLHLSEGYKGVLIISEFGPWLESLEKSYIIGLKGLLTDFYDVPEQRQVKTKTGGELIVREPFISIAGVSTLPWIEKNLSKDDVSIGFFARFLIFYPPYKETVPAALPGKKQMDRGAEKRLFRLLDRIPQGRRYMFTPKAEKLFDILHNNLHRSNEKLPQESQHLFHPYLKRWSPYILKLAMIMQFCDDPGSVKIKERAIRVAAYIVNYAITSTTYLFRNELGKSPHQIKCAKVLRYIKKNGSTVTRGKLQSSHILDGGSQDYDYVLESLITSGQIDIDRAPKMKKSAWVYRLVTT